ncbi:MAG: phosphoglycerate kinase [Patescibacteria group bacterium]
MRYLSRLNLTKWAGKTCLLRIDLNIEPTEVEDSYRILAIIPTIKLLLKNHIRIILLSHRGRPTGEDRSLSLKPFAEIIEKKLGRPIRFIPHFNFSALEWQLKNSSAKDRIWLLENLRFLPGEGANNPILGQKLALLGDFYVNDAFAVCHRTNSSVTAITRELPAYAGLLMEREIKNLDQVMRKFKKPLTLILGGAKIEDKIGVIKYFWEKAEHILLGGGPANTFLMAKKHPIGKSVVNKKVIPLIKRYLKSPKIVLPTDFKIYEGKILDIGGKSVKEFVKIIQRSKTIIYNGPMGVFEQKRFEHGSFEIAKAIAKTRAFTVVGGGETTAVFTKLGLIKKIKFVSTGGGAMLDYLSGKKLPGIDALK